MTGEVEEEEAKWLAKPLAPENRPFSSEEIWKGIYCSGTDVGVKRCVETVAKTPGKEWNKIFGQKITESPSARFYRRPLVQLETVFPSTFPKYRNYMHSLKLKKEKYKELYAFWNEKTERRKEKKKRTVERDICV